MMLLAAYSLQKTHIVVSKTGQTMMQTVKDNFFTEADSFSHLNGLALAFAITNDDLDLAPLTPDIGSL